MYIMGFVVHVALQPVRARAHKTLQLSSRNVPSSLSYSLKLHIMQLLGYQPGQEKQTHPPITHVSPQNERKFSIP